MISFKNIISIWIIANILFIPGFKSVALVPDQLQHVCMIDTFNDESKKTHILKLHCENCNFFTDYDSDTFLVRPFHSNYYVHISRNINRNSLFFTSDNYNTSPRAPPHLS